MMCLEKQQVRVNTRTRNTLPPIALPVMTAILTVVPMQVMHLQGRSSGRLIS